MKKSYYLFSFIIILVLLYISGPTVSFEAEFQEIKLEEDIDAYLQKTESKISGIRPDTEKKIFWHAGKVGKRTKYSLVYLHGFGATRQEIAPVAQHVANQLQANIFYTRLKGHGRDADAMGEATVQDWINDGNEALYIGKELGENIILVGTSTGATLSTWLVSQNLDVPIKAMIMVSPNFWPKNKAINLALMPWGEQLIGLILGEYRSWEPANEKQRMYWTTKQSSSAILPMMGLVNLVDQLDLNKIMIPLLVIHSDYDQVVDSEKTVEKFSQFGSSENKLFKINDSEAPSQHLITGDIISPSKTKMTIELMLDFVKGLD